MFLFLYYMNILIFDFLMVCVFENAFLQISSMILLDAILHLDYLSLYISPYVCQDLLFLFPVFFSRPPMMKSYNSITPCTSFVHGQSTLFLLQSTFLLYSHWKAVKSYPVFRVLQSNLQVFGPYKNKRACTTKALQPSAKSRKQYSGRFLLKTLDSIF